jgi:hypothetical protein
MTTQKQIKDIILKTKNDLRPSDVNFYARQFYNYLKVKTQTKSSVNIVGDTLVMQWERGKYSINLYDNLHRDILPQILN